MFPSSFTLGFEDIDGIGTWFWLFYSYLLESMPPFIHIILVFSTFVALGLKKIGYVYMHQYIWHILWGSLTNGDY